MGEFGDDVFEALICSGELRWVMALSVYDGQVSTGYDGDCCS